MLIRKAEEKDIPRILELLGQVLQIHADIRPDIFIPGTTKYTTDELTELLKNEEKPVYVAVDEADVCVGGLRGAVTQAARDIEGVSVFEGRVCSGDQFIGSAAAKERIVSTFGGMCCEMEGAAIAHACHIAGVPFVVVRAISDKADDSGNVDYPTFERAAAAHCASIVLAALPRVA